MQLALLLKAALVGKFAGKSKATVFHMTRSKYLLYFTFRLSLTTVSVIILLRILRCLFHRYRYKLLFDSGLSVNRIKMKERLKSLEISQFQDLLLMQRNEPLQKSENWFKM